MSATFNTDSRTDWDIMEEVLFIETITNSNTSYRLSSPQSSCQNFVVGFANVAGKVALNWVKCNLFDVHVN